MVGVKGHYIPGGTVVGVKGHYIPGGTVVRVEGTTYLVVLSWGLRGDYIPGGTVVGVRVLLIATVMVLEESARTKSVTSPSKGKCPPLWLATNPPFTHYINTITVYISHAHPWEHIRGSTSVGAHPWEHIRGSTLMGAHPWEHTHGSTPMGAAHPWEHTHGSTSMGAHPWERTLRRPFLPLMNYSVHFPP